MKNTPVLFGLSLKRLLPLASAIASILAVSPTHASDVYWVSTGTAGTYNWSGAGNWLNSAAPASSGGDTVYFNAPGASIISSIDSAWAVSGSVAGLVFASDTSSTSYTYTLNLASNQSLTIGSGGLTNNKTKGGITLNGGTIVIGDEQTWKIVTPTGWNASDVVIQSNLSGTGNLTLSGSGASYVFSSGITTAYSGTITLNSSDVRLQNGQLSRLGSTFVFGNGTSTFNKAPGLYLSPSGANQQQTFSTNINFVNTGSLSRTFSVQGTTTGSSSLALTGVWSGTMNSCLYINSTANSGTSPISDDLVVRFQANNSSLGSTQGGGTQSASALWLQYGVFSIENANALGLNNSLSVSMGANTTTVQAARSSLFAADGITINSKIYLDRLYSGAADTARSLVAKLGINTTGSSAFNGALTLDVYDNPGAQTNSRLANVHLVAATGGTASFNGKIADSGSNGAFSMYAPVSVEGGGTVILTSGSNQYQGGTSVIGNTTLVVNNASGSATGAGSLRVGYAASSFTGTTTVGSSTITGISGTGGLVIGQTISGPGIPAGAIITYIASDRVEISLNATAAGAVTLTTAAEKGILSGTGRIAPGVVTTSTSNIVQQSISLAANSTIDPGVNGVGTLTLDGTATSAPLLTAAEGSIFTFSLGLGGSSSQIAFWNYHLGDFVLSGTGATLNFTGTPVEGTYTLFTFYSNGGTTASTDGITSGLNLGAGLDGYDGVLAYNGSTVTLTLTEAVPEPVTWVLLTSGLGVLVLGRRLRRRNA